MRFVYLSSSMGIQAVKTYTSRDYNVKSVYALPPLWCSIVCDFYKVVRMNAKQLFNTWYILLDINSILLSPFDLMLVRLLKMDIHINKSCIQIKQE